MIETAFTYFIRFLESTRKSHDDFDVIIIQYILIECIDIIRLKFWIKI